MKKKKLKTALKKKKKLSEKSDTNKNIITNVITEQ